MTTGPALACPRQLLCIVETSHAAAPEVSRTTTPAPVPDVRQITLPPDHHLTFEAPPKRDPNELEMPWIWRVLREETFTLVLSPVVVTTPSDTIPGVGVAGDF
jgi:hypothetical protein